MRTPATDPRRRPQAGFTIVELLTVITVIGILAAAAAPSFTSFLRDRRVDDAARNIADMYRRARAHALGRGAAVMVRWNLNAALPTNANPAAQFTMLEGVVGATSPFNPVLPNSTCNENPQLTKWVDGSDRNLFVQAFEPRRARYAPSSVLMYDGLGNQTNYVELCFTPRGRTFVNYAVGGTFAPLTGVPRVDVINTVDQRIRAVIIPPTGAARVVRRAL